MPTLEEIIRLQRKNLLAREAAIVSDLEAQFNSAIADLEGQLAYQEALVQKRIAEGANPLSASITVARTNVMIQLLGDMVADVAADVMVDVLLERKNVIIASHKDFVDAANAADVRAGVDPGAISRIGLAVTTDTPVRRLFENLPDVAAAAARDALFTGVATGQNPRQIAAAMRHGAGLAKNRASTIARTEVMRAYRNASLDRMHKAPEIEKWVWISARDRRTCAFCWAQHGRTFSTERQMASHPNCRCSMGPLPKGANTTAIVGNGTASFNKLKAADQLHILGGAKYRALKNGAIELRDLIGSANHKDWGPIGYERSLRSVLGNDLAKKYYAQNLSLMPPPVVKAAVSPPKPKPAPKPKAAPPPPPPPAKGIRKPTKEEMVNWDKSAGWAAVAKTGGIPNAAPSATSYDTPPKYKAKVAESIGKELDRRALTNPALQKQLATMESGGRGATPGIKTADKLVGVWASTSADNHPISLALQRTVAAEFNVPIPKHLEARANHKTVDIELKENGELYKNFAQVEYAQTQAYLKANGITEMTLYRGQGVDEADMPGVSTSAQTYASKVTLQPISSFSVEYSTAVGFGTGQFKTVVAVRVPAEQIFATPATAIGCLSEGEFVVLGGTDLPAHVLIQHSSFYIPSHDVTTPNPFKASSNDDGLNGLKALIP